MQLTPGRRPRQALLSPHLSAPSFAPCSRQALKVGRYDQSENVLSDNSAKCHWRESVDQHRHRDPASAGIDDVDLALSRHGVLFARSSPRPASPADQDHCQHLRLHRLAHASLRKLSPAPGSLRAPSCPGYVVRPRPAAGAVIRHSVVADGTVRGRHPCWPMPGAVGSACSCSRALAAHPLSSRWVRLSARPRSGGLRCKMRLKATNNLPPGSLHSPVAGLPLVMSYAGVRS
jgi:hypothetical protein